jgi:hypothetical protein
MTVLVSSASKHGSTAEIAQAIGRVLTEHGVPADVRPLDGVTSVAYTAPVGPGHPGATRRVRLHLRAVAGERLV